MIEPSSYLLIWVVSFALTVFGLSSSSSIFGLKFARPIIGFSRFVILSQIISVTTGWALLNAAYISCVILGVNAIWYFRKQKARLVFEMFSPFFTLAFGASIILSIMWKSQSPFGTYNFDFVYGVQDGLYLADHSVRIPPAQGGGFPFDWGSVGIGRYCGIFLVTIINEITKSPLLAAILVYAISIALIFLSLIFFCQKVFRYTALRSVALSVFAILSPLSLFGFHNQLIGQTTGISVTITLLAILVSQRDWPALRANSYHWIVATLVAGLFWIYPAQLILLLPVLAVLVLLIYLDAKKDGSAFSILVGIVIVISLLLVSFSRDFKGTLNRIHTLIFYSSESQGATLYDSIFNQLSSKKGPVISSGFLEYGDTSSWWPILLIFTIVLVLVVSILRFKALISAGRNSLLTTDSVLSILYFYILGAYIILFFTQSNYLLFKISTWFSPLMALLFIATLTEYRHLFKEKWKIFFIIFIIPAAYLMVNTSHLIAGKAMSGSDIPFTYSRLSFDNDLLERINESKNSVLLSMPSMEEAAWITINMPRAATRETINFFGYDQQSLYLGFSRTLPEFPLTKQTDSVFILKKGNDIFPDYSLTQEPVWENREMVEIQLKNLERHFVFGVGAFYPDRAKVSPFGEGVPFRWSNGYINFGVYSKSKQTFDLKVPVKIGPDFRGKFSPKTNNGSIVFKSAASGMELLEWRGITINPGWNTLELHLSDQPIFRTPKNSLRPDFRPLSVAIGKMQVTREEK